MPKLQYNLKAIMAAAHRFWAMQKATGFMGARASFADALRRAWRAAKQEAFQLSRGCNIGLTDYVICVEAAPVVELARAA